MNEWYQLKPTVSLRWLWNGPVDAAEADSRARADGPGLGEPALRLLLLLHVRRPVITRPR